LDNKAFDIIDARCSHEDSSRVLRSVTKIFTQNKSPSTNKANLDVLFTNGVALYCTVLRGKQGELKSGETLHSQKSWFLKFLTPQRWYVQSGYYSNWFSSLIKIFREEGLLQGTWQKW